MTDPTRGVLYPERLPSFTRLAPEGEASTLVEWFWIPQWDLPETVVSRQPVLGYPAANLVVEPDGVTLWGATTRASERELRGSGWAVGALLKPAAFARLYDAPSDLVDAHTIFDEPNLQHAVSAAMPDLDAAAAAVSEWLVERVGPPTSDARLANAMADLLMSDPTVLRLDDAAERLRVSVRTLQRLAHRTVGLSPAAMIRRRRLQEAAQRVREDPDAPLADIAAELGYADQAHLANDFRAVLGFTATDYRADR
ncbi:AraC-like DNA-binding protein [Microbacterium trichothecenolyticum]|uniref:helix-turn-helix domain-containing protein n=1 Tax=Microbacterium trichothecenolyticum TaxID=69370 RepID=UPI0028615A51|nr:helix-turn-helix domain-containing protein [Microbacterium trichothecenolyticum]MDR7186622.1 AraC-like DNA-binding protein [Microbacterium trichothecenolyticum]